MKTLFSLLLVLALVNKISAQSTDMVSAKIITNKNQGLTKIQALAVSNSATFHDLNYILVSVKKGKSGTSSNKQSGKFSLKPNETKILSETNLNIDKDDALKVYLFLKDEETDEVISKDSLEVHTEKFASETVDYIPEHDLELSGITIDDTRTKFGQFFYDSFYKKYNQIPKKFEGTITISELPSFGRSSRIVVTIDDQTIYSFLTQPNEELLEGEADRTLAILIEYNSRNSLRNKEFKY